ncbi:hypothetical protein IG631_12418 [Alternaria alternata]|nr:hypothetical protein IG631_12418 [Alternaria alternata]
MHLTSSTTGRGLIGERCWTRRGVVRKTWAASAWEKQQGGGSEWFSPIYGRP